MRIFSSLRNLISTYWNDYTKIVLLILVAGLFWYFMSITAAFFWTVFIAFIIFNIESTIIGQAALVCLVSLPILLALHKDGMAEQVAVYAYFLLSMTVGLQIIDLYRLKHNDDPLTKPQPLIPAALDGAKRVRKMIVDIVPRRKI